jgi:GDP-4-dehydro-6-deoxy-D-mannose reductase
MAAGSLAPMRAFLTGGQGFVGTWLVRHLEEQGDEVTAPGPDVDITDAEALAAAVADARPEAIYHLAALANVSESWQDPVGTFEVNATGTLHLLEAARRVDPYPRVLLVCSAEVYGSVDPHRMPIVEDTPLRPVTPYAASKVAAEFLGMQAHLAYGLPVLRVRAFNHVGPSQAGSFVVSDLARGIAEAERNGTGVLRAGNLAAKRDFTDVRDVVRAYRLLVERGTAGEGYNVCSGRRSSNCSTTGSRRCSRSLASLCSCSRASVTWLSSWVRGVRSCCSSSRRRTWARCHPMTPRPMTT